MVKATKITSSATSMAGFGLEAEFADTLKELLAVCKQAGLEFRPSQGLRSPIVQAEYYCRWVKHPPEQVDQKITFLKDHDAPWLAELLERFRDIPRQKAFLTGQLPGSGWHQWGLAADCYCYRNGKMVQNGSDPAYKAYAEAAVKLGLTAGYYFKQQDSGHVQARKENGASDVYSWKFIDQTMRERFAERKLVALKKGAAGESVEPGSLGFDVVAPAAVTPALARAATAVAVPPSAKEADIVVVDPNVKGPGGIVFGKLFKLGLVNFGKTTIDAFFEQDTDAFPDTPDSVKRVMRAVSPNEGKIEAINTYDSAFLSVGIYQWTAGADAGDGELAGLLELLRKRAPAAFDMYFGSLGIDVVMSAGSGLRRGFLTLQGTPLKTAAQKKVLRKHIWAYRFWRAAHDVEMRRAQIDLAMQRIGIFHRKAIPGKGGRSPADYITSEFGVALLLDQHVNRPSHVTDTLVEAIDQFVASGKPSDPQQWTSASERRVLELYLKARKNTSMTDSDKRAKRIADLVAAGGLSGDRGSFVD